MDLRTIKIPPVVGMTMSRSGFCHPEHSAAELVFVIQSVAQLSLFLSSRTKRSEVKDLYSIE
jgi:hypothetical protein